VHVDRGGERHAVAVVGLAVIARLLGAGAIMLALLVEGQCKVGDVGVVDYREPPPSLQRLDGPSVTASLWVLFTMATVFAASASLGIGVIAFWAYAAPANETMNSTSSRGLVIRGVE
jgi:hypothetical protein